MPQPGQRISEYVLEERIGGGGFGEVWRARHHVWANQLVAIKIPTDPQYLRSLQHEGVVIHGLQHPNIVRAMNFDPYADPPYLVMEFVPGTSLRPLIQARTLSVADSVVILKSVLAALAHAHSRGMVHRDIKPENILIHEEASSRGYAAEGMVRVTDFGLGKAVGLSANSILISTEMDSQKAAQIAGTLDYMAPEQRSGGEIDARADLYACGVVLFEMLTGDRPAGTELPADVNPAVPAHLNEAFRRSFTRLEKRFASAEEFARALDAPVAPPVVSPPMGRPPAQVGPPPVGPRADACPSCGRSVAPTDQFCMFCGVQVVATVRRCPQCGAYPDWSDRFCIHCGQALAEPAGV